MAYSVFVMPAAHADLNEYTDYIARDSERYASEWLLKAWDIIFSLSDNPKRFTVSPESEEIGAEVRDVVHFSHRIVYMVNDDDQTVEILRVYHSARKPLSRSDIDK